MPNILSSLATRIANKLWPIRTEVGQLSVALRHFPDAFTMLNTFEEVGATGQIRIGVKAAADRLEMPDFPALDEMHEGGVYVCVDTLEETVTLCSKPGVNVAWYVDGRAKPFNSRELGLITRAALNWSFFELQRHADGMLELVDCEEPETAPA